MSPTPEDEKGDLLDYAWAVIANVGHKIGGWEVQDPEWVEGAERWRDRFFAYVKDRAPADPTSEEAQ